jgi:hypothetical protein
MIKLKIDISFYRNAHLNVTMKLKNLHKTNVKRVCEFHPKPNMVKSNKCKCVAKLEYLSGIKAGAVGFYAGFYCYLAERSSLYEGISDVIKQIMGSYCEDYIFFIQTCQYIKPFFFIYALDK